MVVRGISDADLLPAVEQASYEATIILNDALVAVT